MNKNKRYVFIPINVRLNEYEFYDDLITNRFFVYKNEQYNIRPEGYIDFDHLFPLSGELYCFIGYLEISNKYCTEKSNELLMFLQQQRLIFSSDIHSNINFSSSCLFSTFQESVFWLQNSFQNDKKALFNNLLSVFSNNKPKNENNIILEHISSTFNQIVTLNNPIFSKNDFQPIFFSNDAYMKHEYVIQIYKNIDDLYHFINNNFNNFIKNSSLKEDYKNIHFLDIEYDLFKHFSDIEDIIIFHDYYGLLNSYSNKFVADFLLSMIKQTNIYELKKIKNYILKKEIKNDTYLLYNILKHYNVQDDIILKERKDKYINLIDNFHKKIETI